MTPDINDGRLFRVPKEGFGDDAIFFVAWVREKWNFLNHFQDQIRINPSRLKLMFE